MAAPDPGDFGHHAVHAGAGGNARATGADRTNAAEHHPWLVGVGGPCRRILHLLLRRASGVAGIGGAGIVPRCAQRRARRPPGLPVLRPVRSDRSCALARGDLSIAGVGLWWTAAGSLLLIAAVFDSVAIPILAAVWARGRVAGRHPGDRGRSGCGVPGEGHLLLLYPVLSRHHPREPRGRFCNHIFRLESVVYRLFGRGGLICRSQAFPLLCRKA